MRGGVYIIYKTIYFGLALSVYMTDVVLVFVALDSSFLPVTNLL